LQSSHASIRLQRGSLIGAICILCVAGLALVSLMLTACSPVGSPSSNQAPPILLFNGSGTSPNDVAALEALLDEHRLSYVTADSRRLNAMPASELRSHRLLIVPGGNFEHMGNGLTSSAAASIRDAVHGGLNYLGICAGAFIAGDSPYNGLNLTEGVRFNFYALEAQNVRKAAVPITVAGSSTFDHYWEDGPELSGWGHVVAKYPDGTPAVVQGAVGNGWMILSGVHPEAPENWRHGMTFATLADVDNAYAVTLIDAALNRTRLAHY
jgi:Biotin-protein ligase, N terminal